MHNNIIHHLDNPRELERLYRTNNEGFKRDFITVYSQIKGQPIADFWHERLHFENDGINWGTGRDLIFVAIVSLLAGFIAKLPALFPISEAYFYSRSIGFIIFPALAAYFAWKNKVSVKNSGIISAVFLVCLLYINFLPTLESDTITLSCIHLIIVLWGVLGFAYVGSAYDQVRHRLGFLKYNGDLIVMTTLIVLAGGIMTGITIGLFSLIGFNIEQFYFDNVVVFGLPAAPIFGTYLTQTNPQLVGKVSPVIAKIFSPLVLVMLTVYLVAMAYSGKDPYTDREFLLIFNGLLVGVLALIFFSLSENSSADKKQMWVLLFLSILTIIVNGIALSAILFRISEWGITPNRAAVLGSNILILANLLLVTFQLFKTLIFKRDIKNAGKIIANYLPIYLIWAIIVTFLFPLIFGF
jgi:hypothetical protein